MGILRFSLVHRGGLLQIALEAGEETFNSSQMSLQSSHGCKRSFFHLLLGTILVGVLGDELVEISFPFRLDGAVVLLCEAVKSLSY